MTCSAVCMLSHVQLFVTPMDRTCQAPLSMGFPRQEYWCGLPFSSPGGLPDPGIKPMPAVLAVRFFTAEPPGKPDHIANLSLFLDSSTYPVSVSCLATALLIDL